MYLYLLALATERPRNYQTSSNEHPWYLDFGLTISFPIKENLKKLDSFEIG